MLHSRPARLFDDFSDTTQARLDRLRSAAHRATVDPEITQMSPRYLRWLMNERAWGMTFEAFKAREDRPAPPPSAAFARAEARSRGEEEAFEPGPVELAEMRSASFLSELTDYCRAARLARENPDAIKAAWNHAAFTQHVPLKMIAWPQWGRQ